MRRSAYANASVNSALASDHTWVPNTPKGTAAAGLIYSRDGVYVSVLAKWVGSRFGDTEDTQHLPSYTTADASVDFDLGQWFAKAKGTKLKINIDNIADIRPIINLAGYTVGAGTPLYWTNPGRSIFATLEFKRGSQQ